MNHESISPSSQSQESTPETNDLLTIDALDTWRAAQHEELARARFAAGFGEDYATEFSRSIDDSVEKFLDSHGVAADSPLYGELADLYRSASIDKVSESEWLYRPSSRGESVEDDHDVAKRQLFAARAQELTAHNGADQSNEQLDSTEYDRALLMNERWEALVNGKRKEQDDDGNEVWVDDKSLSLATSREKLAQLAAKRQGRLFGKGGEAYVHAKQEYDAKIRELGMIQFSDSREMYDQMSDEQRTQFRAQVTEYLFAEQTKLREATTEKLKGTRVGKFVEWMQSGSKKKRFGKGLLVGAVGAGAGAVLSFAAVGAGLAVGAGAIAVGTSRFGSFARGYSRHDKRGMATLSDEQKNELQQNLQSQQEGVFDASQDHTKELYEKDSHLQQVERRKAVGKALAIMGVGAMLGEGIHLATEHAGDITDFVRHGHTSSTTHQPGEHPTTTKDLQHQADAQAAAKEAGQHGAMTGANEGIQQSSTHGATGLDHGASNHTPDSGNTQPAGPGQAVPEQFSHDALTITPGEGFYSEFQQMGVPRDQWAGLLHDIGPKLHDQGYAYFQHTSTGADSLHGVRGEWRIGGNAWGNQRFPERLPNGALKVITETAKQNGYDLAA